ncbi:complement regulator-acquiring protein (plasmid) [Borrelia anserina]|uniref:Antigen P35 n=1 Tax=Borrelia anserina Es TaxID=1365188 RepID=A0ABM6FVJ9_BORAN|nr:complement regulator-acquiring protein [Borrelia anserina]APR65328.1 hypothetical protein N187_A09 [Borrelia anserina Es]UPA07296.1 complement regulator-acquiring protein [Borrelia anserina]
MRNNITNKIFITFALTALILTGCDPGSRCDPDSKLNQKNNSPNIATNSINQKDKAQKNNVISILKKKVTDEQTLQKGKTEDPNQYGMKTNLFQKLTHTKNQKTYDDKANDTLRKQFYASLSWVKKTIEDFGKIIAQIEGDSTHKGTWPQDLINSGQNIQEELEKAINKIDLKKDKLESLSLEKLNEVKTKVDEIEKLRQTWAQFAEDIIKDHTADTGQIKNDVQKLVAHIKTKYDTNIKPELDNIKQKGNDIQKILDEIK